jgi:hypothetical protein
LYLKNFSVCSTEIRTLDKLYKLFFHLCDLRVVIANTFFFSGTGRLTKTPFKEQGVHGTSNPTASEMAMASEMTTCLHLDDWCGVSLLLSTAW